MAKNRSGIVGDLEKACSCLEVTGIDIISTIENGPDFFGMGAYNSDSIICLRIAFKSSDNKIVEQTKKDLKRLYEF